MNYIRLIQTIFFSKTLTNIVRCLDKNIIVLYTTNVVTVLYITNIVLYNSNVVIY